MGLRAIHIVGLQIRYSSLALSAMFLANIGCGGGQRYSSLSQLKQEATIKVTPIEGGEQVIAPRLLYETPVKFKVSDPSGNPLAGMNLEFKLCNVQEFETLPDVKELADAWDKPCGPPTKLHLADSKLLDTKLAGGEDSLLEEEYLGRINRADYVTDSTGTATLAVEAARIFDTTVLLIARVKDNQFSGGLGYSVLKTASFGAAAKFKVNTTNGMEEIAGTAFEIWVTALDNDGFAIRSYRGNMELTFLAEPKGSWAGLLPEFPDPKIPFICPFSGGKCVIPGGPYTLRASGDLGIVVHSTQGVVPDVLATVKVIPGKPESIVAATKLGGPDEGAEVKKTLEISAGDSFSLAAAFVDRGGNYIGDATNAVWTSTSPAIARSLPTGGATSFNFVPLESGEGEVFITSGTIQSIDPLFISVPSGPQVKWIVRTEGGGRQVAGECFSVQILAADSNDNINRSFTGSLVMDLSMTGTESGPAVRDVAHWSNYGLRIPATMQTTVAFVKGIGNLQERACLFDASNVTPTILASNSATTAIAAFSGSVVVDLVKGGPAGIILSTTPPGDDIVRACIPLGVFRADDVYNPCMKVSADLTSVTYYPVVVDGGGNYLRSTPTTWNFTGPFTSGNSGTSVTGEQVITITSNGVGLLTATTPENYYINYSYEVTPGAPHHYGISGIYFTAPNSLAVDDTAEPFTAYTVSPFNVRVNLYDQKNNVVTNFNGVVNLNFSITNASNSPNTPPDLSVTSLVETVTIVQGRGITTGTLNPRNSLDTNAMLNLSGTLGSTSSAQALQILPGPPKSIKVLSSPDGTGTDKSLATTYAVGQSENRTFYISGLDLYGNFTGPVSSSVINAKYNVSLPNYPNGDWTPGQEPFTFVPSTAVTAFYLFPQYAGTGIFTVAPTDTNITGLTTQTMTVTTGAAVKYRMRVGSWVAPNCNALGGPNDQNAITAGVDFCLKVEALDQVNMVQPDYVGNMNLQFSSAADPSWAGDTPILPDGLTICNFEAGVCNLEGPYMLVAGGKFAVLNVFDQDGVVKDGAVSVFGISIQTNAGTSSRIAIADKLGGPGAGAVVYKTPINITADDTISLAAALVDAGGNYIANADVSVAWAGSSADPDVFQSANFVNQPATPALNNPKSFIPVKVGSGTISATLAPYITGVTPAVTINHGALHHVTTTTQNNGTEQVGVCFTFAASLMDQKENVITTYTALTRTNLTILNGVSGPAPSRFTNPFFCPAASGYCGNNGDQAWQHAFAANGGGSSLNNPATPNAWPYRGVFNGQIDTADLKVCLYDGTNVTPSIKFDLAAVNIPNTAINFAAFSDDGDPISIAVGAPQHVHPAAADDPTAPSWPCTTYNSGGCANYNVDNGPQILYGHVHDRGCNFIANATGTWDASGTLIASDVVIPAPSGPSHSIKLNNTKSSVPYGTGDVPSYGMCYQGACSSLRFNSSGAYLNGQSDTWGFRISPGVTTDFTAIINNGQSVKADLKFPIEIRLLDQYSNITGFNDIYNIAFSYGATATNSRIGTTPKRASNGNKTFTNGYWLSGNLDFHLPTSTDSPVLTITPSAGPVTFSPKNFNIPVNVGTIVATKLLNTSCLGSVWNNVSNPDLTGVPISMLTSDIRTIQHQGFDIEENCAGGVNASFSVATTPAENPVGTLSGTWPGGAALSPSSGTFFTLAPRQTGSATVKVDPVTAGLPDLYTGLVTVGHGPIAGFMVTSAGNGTEAAGAFFDLTVTAIDSFGNTVSDFTGSKALSFSIIYDVNNPALIMDNPENRNHLLPANTNYTFNNGVATGIQAKVFNSLSTPRINVTHVSGATYTGTYLISTVTPGIPHHYGVNAPWYGYPRSNYSSKFSITIEMRDAHGNKVTDIERQANVSIARTGAGSWNLGTVDGLTNPVTIPSGGSVTLSNLAYDVAGTHKFVVAATSGGFSSISSASDTIDFYPRKETVANYEIVATGSPQAGTAYFLQIKAIDNAGNVISIPSTTFDSDLSGMTWGWAGANNAPTGETPLLPTSMTFSNGVSTNWVTFYKAETIASLVLSDSQSTPRSGTKANLVVSPGNIAKYEIVASQTTRNAESASTLTATITAFDTYKNPRAGDGNLQLYPVYVSSTGGQTLVGTFAPSGAVTALNAGSGSVVTGAFSYNVGHTITFGLSGMAGGATVTAATEVTYTPTINTIASYGVVPGSTSIVAGASNQSNTISAKDAAGNVITQIDGVLGSQAYNWTGAGTSPSPSSTAPTYGTLSAWSSGVATVTHSLRRAETLSTASLRIADNYSTPRTGFLTSAVTVNPAAANDLTITAIGTKTAGVPFTAQLKVVDQWANTTDSGCSGNNLTISGGSTSSGGWGGAATPPSHPSSQAIPAPASQPFNTGNITLFKEENTNLSFTACGLSAKIAAVNVDEGAVNRVYVWDSATPPTSGKTQLSDLPNKKCSNTGSGSNITCPTLYSYFYDAYGNRIDDANNTCPAWSWANNSGSATSPTFSASGASIAPTATNFIDGNITCTRSGIASSLNLYGGLSRIAITHNYNEVGPLSAQTENISLTKFELFMRRAGSEVVKDDAAAAQNIAFSTNSGVPMGTAGGQIGQNATISCTFDASGVCDRNSTPIKFNMTLVEAAKTHTFTFLGKSSTISNINVSGNTANSIQFVSFSPASPKPGEAFTASVNILDAFGNKTNAGCTGEPNLTTSGGASSPGGHGGSATAPSHSSVAVPVAASQPFNSGTMILYNKAGATITFSACGKTLNQAISVADGGTSAINAVYLNDSTTPPGTSLAEKKCTNNNTTTSAVSCGAIYSFFYDIYGNRVDDANNLCGTWSFAVVGGSSAPSLSATSNAASTIVTSSNFVDGNLTCSRNSKSASILMFGGTSEASLTTLYNGVGPIAANTNNLAISDFKVFYRKNGALTPKDDASGSKTIQLSKTSTQSFGTGAGQLGQNSTVSCSFDGSGVCVFSGDLKFHMTKAESGTSLTLSLYGKSASVTNINVNPTTAATVNVVSVSTSTPAAGAAMTAQIQILDTYSNKTDVGCGNLTVTSNANTSDGGHGGTGTAPTMPAAQAIPVPASQPFTTGNITLYKKESVTLTFAGCSATSGTANVTVSPAAINAVYLNDTNSAPADSKIDRNCPNDSAANSNVSCPAVYAFFYDAYGNEANAAGDKCSTWAYTKIGSSATPSLSSAGNSTATTLTATNWIDGNLRCTTANSKFADILLYGGVESATLTNNYSSSVVAGTGNISVSAMNLFFKKNGSTIAKTDVSGTPTITLSSSSTQAFGTGGGQLGQNASLTGYSFDSSGVTTFTSSPRLFNFTKAETGKSLTFTVFSVGATISGINVTPATAATVNVTSLSASQTAGAPFTAQVQILDQHLNKTDVGCTAGNKLSITSNGSASPGGHGGSVGNPTMPSDQTVAVPASQPFTTGNITLHKAEAVNLTFAACGATNDVKAVTVNTAAANVVYLSTTDSAPASHLTSLNCPAGSTVTCGTLYAFSWDAWGNDMATNASVSCSSWSYPINNTGNSAPTLSNASGHSSYASHSTYHIDGTIRCSYGGKNADTTVFGQIQKNYNWSCGNWTCPASDTPRATCNVSQSTGYPMNSLTFDPIGEFSTTAACSSGIASGANCNVTIIGTTGAPSSSLGVIATSAAPTTVAFNNPANVQVQSGANAPNCSGTLGQSTSAWSCVAGKGRYTTTLTNNNTLLSATFPNSDPAFTTSNGGVLVSTSCKNGSVAPAGTCTATVENPNAGVSDTMRFSPNDGFFAQVDVTKGSSPNCSQSVTISAPVEQSETCVSDNKRVMRYTVSNPNTLNAVTLASSPAVTATNGTVVGGTCNGATLNTSSSNSCTFDIEYTVPNGSPSSTNATVGVTGGYHTNTSRIADTIPDCP